MIPAAKRSRRSSQLPPPSSTTIDNLPDFVLVEVLGRLAHNKLVFQCKLVSKRWRHILSDSYFAGRFLRLHQDDQQQKPLIENNGYVMVISNKLQPYASGKPHNFVVSTSPKDSKPSGPVLKTTSSVLSFLPPCFNRDEVHVVGTCNDLVLCSPTTTYQSDYYVCNPHTKNWVRLPPSPRIFKDLALPVGFICEPYYNFKNVDGPSSIIKLNHEFRFKVVRLIPKDSPNNISPKPYYVEMFSSETGEWSEYPCTVIRLSNTDNYFQTLACNGKLYWCTRRGFGLVLDPFNISSSTNIGCRNIIDPPATIQSMGTLTLRLGVCQERLRMCQLSSDGRHMIWELKQNQVDGKPKWSLMLNRSQMSILKPNTQLPTPMKLRIVGFHPSDGDILFMELLLEQSDGPGLLFMCHVREKWLGKSNCAVREIFPYVTPLWPTPLPYYEIEEPKVTTAVDCQI